MITRRKFIDGAVAGIVGASVASSTRSYAQILGTDERVGSISTQLYERASAPSTASMMVGLVVPDPFQRFFAEIAVGLSDALALHGYGLIISSSRHNADLENKVVKQMLARNVDALIVATCESQTATLELAAREVPLVLLDRRIGGAAFQFVGTDDALAGELATQHLIDIGRRRIAYIGANVSSSNDRERAYRTVLSRNNVEARKEYQTRTPGNGELDHVLGEKQMQRLLTLTPRPDAVFCYNDPIAWGATTAILDSGLRIPEDIAIVGCGNTLYNSLMKVPLTSVDQNTASLGSVTADMSVHAIEQRFHKKEYLPAAALLKPTLVVRESTSGVNNNQKTKI
jgi:LacI family transcriptional regulator